MEADNNCGGSGVRQYVERYGSGAVVSGSRACDGCAHPECPKPLLDDWICEEHPHLPWPHDNCGGPGMLSEAAIRRINRLEGSDE